MIKRLSIVAFFTGSAYLFTILSLKYLSISTSASNLKSIGEVDSLVNLIIIVLAAGMLMSSIRNIAISADWKKEFETSQQARLTLGLIISVLALLCFSNSNYILFLFAPLIALNGDYALYGRSKPILASILAFIKVFFPYLVMIVVLMVKPEWLIPSFIFSTAIVYLVTGYSISSMLDVPYLVRPSLRSLQMYMESIGMGVVSFSYYFIGLGLIWLAGFFYTDLAVAAAFLGIKLYTIFKGVLRMLNQSFFKEMTEEAVRLKVDSLAFHAGIVFLLGTLLFPAGFTGVFFNKSIHFQDTSFFLLGITGLLVAPLISLHTAALLERKDKLFSKVALLATAASAALCVLLSFTYDHANSIFISLLAGELVILAGLIIISGKKNLFYPRVMFFIKNAPLLIVPILGRMFFGDNPFTFFASLLLYVVLFLMLNWKFFHHHRQEAEVPLYES